MLLIGENLNVINMVIGKAFKEKDPGPIAEEARKQKHAEYVLIGTLLSFSLAIALSVATRWAVGQ